MTGDTADTTFATPRIFTANIPY